MSDWSNVYLTDKSGKKFFNTVASPMSTESEVRNLKRQLENAKMYPDMYKFLDISTAKVMVNEEQVYPIIAQDLNDIMKELEDAGF